MKKERRPLEPITYTRLPRVSTLSPLGIALTLRLLSISIKRRYFFTIQNLLVVLWLEAGLKNGEQRAFFLPESLLQISAC